MRSVTHDTETIIEKGTLRMQRNHLAALQQEYECIGGYYGKGGIYTFDARSLYHWNVVSCIELVHNRIIDEYDRVDCTPDVGLERLTKEWRDRHARTQKRSLYKRIVADFAKQQYRVREKNNVYDVEYIPYPGQIHSYGLDWDTLVWFWRRHCHKCVQHTFLKKG